MKIELKHIIFVIGCLLLLLSLLWDGALKPAIIVLALSQAADYVSRAECDYDCFNCGGLPESFREQAD